MKHVFTPYILIFLLASCSQDTNELLGSWDNNQGQIFEFKPGGEVLWIFYSETGRDTFQITYTTDFSTTPKQLDLAGFETGPLTGKTLFGIIEFENDTSFRVDFEPSKANRPKDFSPDDTQTYYKIDLP